LNRIVRGKKKI